MGADGVIYAVTPGPALAWCVLRLLATLALRMRPVVNASKIIPHPEERRGEAAARLEGRWLAMQPMRRTAAKTRQTLIRLLGVDVGDVAVPPSAVILDQLGRGGASRAGDREQRIEE